MCEWVWIRESLFGTGAGLEEAEVVVVGAGVVEGPAVAGAMVTSEVIFFVVAKRGLRFAVFRKSELKRLFPFNL
jgi:hypothetical protein